MTLTVHTPPAILKINGEKLLKIEDDGAFLKWVSAPSPRRRRAERRSG
jgi:hypothetical protein